MKKIFIIIGLFVTLSSCGQDIPQSLVPSVVVNAFQQKFPKASDIEWEQKAGFYNVEFEITRIEYEAVLDNTGQVLKYKQEIMSSDLPQVILDDIKKNYSTYSFDDIDKIQVGTTVVYKIELDGDSDELKLYYRDNGKLLERDKIADFKF